MCLYLLPHLEYRLPFGTEEVVFSFDSNVYKWILSKKFYFAWKIDNTCQIKYLGSFCPIKRVMYGLSEFLIVVSLYFAMNSARGNRKPNNKKNRK